MKRYGATTAIALILASPAFAQDQSSAEFVQQFEDTAVQASDLIGSSIYTESPPPQAGQAESGGQASGQSATTTGQSGTATGQGTTTTGQSGTTTGQTGTTTGQQTAQPQGPVYDDIGDVSDLVLSRDGQIQAVVVSVGGFLGLGAKEVAITMDSLEFVQDGESAEDYRIVVQSSEEELENAPEYAPDEQSGEGDDAAQSGGASGGGQSGASGGQSSGGQSGGASGGQSGESESGDEG